MTEERMTVQQAGHIGGSKVRDKYGPEFYSEIGRKGVANRKHKYAALKKVAAWASEYMSITGVSTSTPSDSIPSASKVASVRGELEKALKEAGY